MLLLFCLATCCDKKSSGAGLCKGYLFDLEIKGFVAGTECVKHSIGNVFAVNIFGGCVVSDNVS